MDITEFKSGLKCGSFSGIYIFAGEEEYLIRYYLRSLRQSLDIDPTFAVFNNPTFEGDELDFSELSEAVKSPPMMSEYKLIEWKRADFSSMKEKDYAALSELVELTRQHPYSIIAFTAEGERLDFGTPKRPSKFVSTFGKDISILRFEKSTENQLYSWLKRHFDALGAEVNMEVLRALVFRSGRSMDTLLSEVQKLSYLAYSRGRAAVTVEDISEVSSSSPESDTFALSNAITERNKPQAYEALDDLKSRRVDSAVVFGMIARTFGDMLSVAMMLDEGESLQNIEKTLKMNPYKLKIYAAAAKKYSSAALCEITASLALADADSKYGGVTGYTAIELFLSRNL